MFEGIISFVPGQEMREFTVLKAEKRETENGRVVNNTYVSAGSIKAVLAAAKPEETQRWRQLQHPVTHKIISRGAPFPDIRPGDVFENNGRQFYIQTKPYNVGGLNHWTIYYCSERDDV